MACDASSLVVLSSIPCKGLVILDALGYLDLQEGFPLGSTSMHKVDTKKLDIVL